MCNYYRQVQHSGVLLWARGSELDGGQSRNRKRKETEKLTPDLESHSEGIGGQDGRGASTKIRQRCNFVTVSGSETGADLSGCTVVHHKSVIVVESHQQIYNLFQHRRKTSQSYTGPKSPS